jgi:hypothetical protein
VKLDPDVHVWLVLLFSWFAVQREPQNLIQSVRKSPPTLLKFYGGHLVPSQHKRKLRCLELCPANDQLVVTRYASLAVMRTKCLL